MNITHQEAAEFLRLKQLADATMSPAPALGSLAALLTPRGCQVYFIRALGTDFVKIGITEAGSLDKRLRSLQCGSPYELKVAASIFTHDPGLELAYHRQFSRCRVRGEWFREDDSLREHIVSLGGTPS